VTDSVAVEDLIKSLEANARLIRASGDLISHLVPGLKIESKQVSVVRLSQESPLRELFAYSIVLAYQKELEKEVPALIEYLTGYQVPDSHDTIVTVLTMLIAIYGISKAFDKLFPKRSKDNIDSTRKTLTKRAAELLGTTTERVMAAMEVLFTGRSTRVLVGASQKVFAPTRNQSRAAIRDKSGQEMVPAETVREAQAAAGLPYPSESDDEPQPVSKLHRNMRIILHAMDKDRQRFGWAGHCPDLFDDRVPMHLEKHIKPSDIFGRDEITGDILLISEENDNGELEPKEFLLLQVEP
jgi:hypothetical protein